MWNKYDFVFWQIGLAQKIKEITLFKGKLTFDRSKPDGMPRRLLDSSALLNMGWQPKVNLERGIKLTYEWYKSKHNKIKKE